MQRRRTARLLAVAGVLALLVTACDGDGAELTTTSSLVASTDPTSATSSTTSAPVNEESTTTTLVGEVVGTYNVVARESESAGETLYIVVPPGAYTDVDIENFVLDLVETETVTFGAEIFDDSAAVEAYRKPEEERTEEETALIAEHHFASVVNGNRIRFQGPFAASGEFTIGS